MFTSVTASQTSRASEPTTTTANNQPPISRRVRVPGSAPGTASQTPRAVQAPSRTVSSVIAAPASSAEGAVITVSRLIQ